MITKVAARFVAVMALSILVCPASKAQTSPKKDPANYIFTIQRMEKNSTCTTGDVFMSGMPRCKTLELAASKVSVPPGTYTAVFNENVSSNQWTFTLSKPKAIIRVGDWPEGAKNRVQVSEALSGCAVESEESALKAYDILIVAFKRGSFTNGQLVTLTIAE
jgi:hypothetical protein